MSHITLMKASPNSFSYPLQLDVIFIGKIQIQSRNIFKCVSYDKFTFSKAVFPSVMIFLSEHLTRKAGEEVVNTILRMFIISIFKCLFV